MSPGGGGLFDTLFPLVKKDYFCARGRGCAVYGLCPLIFYVRYSKRLPPLFHSGMPALNVTGHLTRRSLLDPLHALHRGKVLPSFRTAESSKGRPLNLVSACLPNAGRSPLFSHESDN